ncbi:MAG TPA: LuxR C-terminal-related transcriptional regulator [Chloroflexota bacterium]
MDKRGAARTAQDIVRLCATGLDSRSLRVEALRLIQKVIPVDSFWFATADPATLLFTSSVVQDIPEHATAAFVANEFLQADVNKWVQLARASRSANGLYMATRGQPDSSPRYREILTPLGFGDELRAALRDGGSCWGFLCLHREQSSPGFTPEEAAFLGRLAPHLAAGLRDALLIGNADVVPESNGPGLLVLADDLSVVATTPAAERWLAELADWPRRRELPQAIYGVSARLRALELDGAVRPDLVPRVRVRTRSGRWLVLHASRLGGPGAPNQTAVILELAHPTEVAPLILEAYDLTGREAQVAQLVLQGVSTDEIAAELCISSLTVQQHLKAVFDKTGVRSRRDLVAQIFTQQYLPRILSGTRLGADGWFAEPSASRLTAP